MAEPVQLDAPSVRGPMVAAAAPAGPAPASLAAEARRAHACRADVVPMTGFCRVDLLDDDGRIGRMTMRCGKSADLCGQSVDCACPDPAKVQCAQPFASRVTERVAFEDGRCEYALFAPEDGACKVVANWVAESPRDSEELIAFGGERRVCGGRVAVGCTCKPLAVPGNCHVDGVYLGPTSRSACRVRWSGCEGKRCAEGETPLSPGEVREYCGKKVSCDEKTATLYPEE